MPVGASIERKVEWLDLVRSEGARAYDERCEKYVLPAIYAGQVSDASKLFTEILTFA